MLEYKDIVFNEQVIGNCTITKEGLYYRFQCHCQFKDRHVHKLFVRTSTSTIPLGICVPDGETFILDKRMAINKIGNEISSILADDTKLSHQMLDLSRLQNAFLDSKAQIAFKDQVLNPQDSDQNRVYPHESSHL